MSYAMYLDDAKQASVTASTVSTAVTMPTGANGLYLANTSATLRVAFRVGAGAAPGAVLLTSALVPPLTAITIEASPSVTHVDAIGPSAGPTYLSIVPIRFSSGE